MRVEATGDRRVSSGVEGGKGPIAGNGRIEGENITLNLFARQDRDLLADG